MADDLSTIFIRVAPGGKFAAYSLRELLDSGHGDEIAQWFLFRLFHDIIQFSHEEPVTEEHVHRMLDALKKLGITIYRVVQD